MLQGKLKKKTKRKQLNQNSRLSLTIHQAKSMQSEMIGEEFQSKMASAEEEEETETRNEKNSLEYRDDLEQKIIEEG